MTARVLVVETGSANLASVLAGLERAGAAPRLTQRTEEVASADRLVLPGVGAFGAVAARLRAMDLVEVLRERVEAERPTLAVCLGMQLLCRESEESPGVAGLAAVGSVVRRFPADVRVPQLGWNRAQADEACRFLRSGYAYFANSYRVSEPPAEWNCASSDHGGVFVAAMERGGVLACQFHPELSGVYGAELLERWIKLA